MRVGDDLSIYQIIIRVMRMKQLFYDVVDCLGFVLIASWQIMRVDLLSDLMHGEGFRMASGLLPQAICSC